MVRSLLALLACLPVLVAVEHGDVNTGEECVTDFSLVAPTMTTYNLFGLLVPRVVRC